MTTLPEAIERLQHELLHDSEYRWGWVCNVAMAIHDTPKLESMSEASWRNAVGERVCRYITAGHPDDPTEHMAETYFDGSHPVRENP